MLRFITRIFLFALLAAFAYTPAMGFGVGLQPTTVEIEVVPGDRNRQVVNIANVHTEQTISLTLGLADWTLDENGQIRLTPPGEDTVSSAASWARFSPAFITLEPGESEQIIVDMTTPSRLAKSGDFRFALLASTILPEERTGQSGVWKKYQIASLFYLTTGPANSDPKITNAIIETNDEGVRTLSFDIENDGNAHARLNGQIEIGTGTNPETVKIGNLVVLNQGVRKYKARLPEGTPADAEVKVKLDNSFAPQANGGALTLPPYKVPTSSWRGAIKSDAQTTSETLP